MLEVADWVDRLNEKLVADFPGKQHQVGHSYFMPSTPIVGTDATPALTMAGVERVWRTDIEPFLQDQLFGQEQKLTTYTLAAVKKSVTAAKQPVAISETEDDGSPDDSAA
jgi:hypothetical protein